MAATATYPVASRDVDADPRPSALVRLTGVSKRWGSTLALDDVTVDIGPGVTGLLGANGAGKTTLIALILGLSTPDAGRVEVLGRPPSPEVRAHLGYAPEHDPLPPEVPAQEFVRHICELHGIPRLAAATRASEALYLVGLGEERYRPLGTLSGGQRQRVKLACAIAHDPTLVLLDEPTEGLDPLQRDEVLRLIRRLGTEFGLSLVVSSHLIHEVERVCDRVVLLDGGRVAAVTEVTRSAASIPALEVVVDGPVEGLLARLRAAGLDAEPVGEERLTVSGPDADLAVRDAVAELGVALRRLQPARPTLEEVLFGDPAGQAGGIG